MRERGKEGEGEGEGEVRNERGSYEGEWVVLGKMGEA